MFINNDDKMRFNFINTKYKDYDIANITNKKILIFISK